jgi:hypothetical protein
MVQELSDSREHVRVKEITGDAATSTLVSIFAASPSFIEAMEITLVMPGWCSSFALLNRSAEYSFAKKP